MASFTILSEVWDFEEKILSDLFVSSYRSRFYSSTFHKSDGRLQMTNHYGSENERIIWDTYNEKSYQEYMREYSHLEPEHRNHHIRIFPNGKKYFKLATSDDSDSNRIAYDLIKEYLIMNPEKIIYEEWSEVVITLNDIKKIESEGGHRKGWYNELPKNPPITGSAE